MVSIDARLWVAPALIFVAFCTFYGFGMTHPATFDELYHVLGARGWLEHDGPVIAEGVYNRAQWFTWIVSQSFRIFGEGLVVARIPTVLPMAGLVVAVFIWTRSTIDPTAAWLATLLFGLSPFAVEISLFIRFYSLQCLAFFIGAICLYRALHGRDGRHWKALQIVAAFLALAFATYLQIATLIGITGIGLWIGGTLALRWSSNSKISLRTRIGAAVLLIALGLVILALILVSGFGSEILSQYRSTPYFNRATADDFWYYHYWINLYYPSLWPIMPVLTLLAFSNHPRVTTFAATIFAIALVLHSFAASKNLRYLAYTMPFLFIILGIGLSVLWGFIVKGLTRLDNDLVLRLSWLKALSKPIARVALIVSILFLIFANTAIIRSLALVAGVTIPPELPNERWEQAAEVLGDELREADVFVTANEMESLYYLGDFDLAWGSSRLSELHDVDEFSRDPRTGRPIISTAKSLEQLQSCYESGLFVTSTRRWREVHWPETEIPFRELLAETSREIDLPEDTHILAYSWDRPIEPSDQTLCRQLSTLIGN